MSEPLWGVGPYLAILIGAAIPTHAWRWLGVLLAGRLDETSELFAYVRAVATALVAAVIAKLLVAPSGALAELPLMMRIGAAAAGFAAYLVSGQRLVIGVLVGEAILLAGWLL